MTKSILIGAVPMVLFFAAPRQDIQLPEALRGYAKWSEVLQTPLPVPEEFWFRCMPTTAADWSAAREKHGPHTQRYIRVYANDAARAALAATKDTQFPAGAVLVKEKRLGAPSAAPEGLAFMIKRTSGSFAATNGWEFLYFPAAGDARRTHDACARCHQSAARDYVFGKYPR